MPSDVIADQHSVLTRAQIVALGTTDSALRANVKAQRWRQLTPTVFVLHNGPLTEEQQWWAATLAVGPLAGKTALAAWGVTGWPSEHIEVLVRRGQRFSTPDGVPVLVHESRRFSDSDVHAARLPRRVSLERAAIDGAAWTKNPRHACGLLAAVVQQRRASAPRLLHELAAAGAVRHRRVLRAVLHDIEGGAQALSEVDLAGLCRQFGLTLEERQVVRLDRSGRRRYLDGRVSAPNGCSVLVEVDGALHLVASTYWDDMRRLNEMVIGGDRVLRFPSIALRLDRQAVGDQLRRACGVEPLRVAA